MLYVLHRFMFQPSSLSIDVVVRSSVRSSVRSFVLAAGRTDGRTGVLFATSLFDRWQQCAKRSPRPNKINTTIVDTTYSIDGSTALTVRSAKRANDERSFNWKLSRRYAIPYPPDNTNGTVETRLQHTDLPYVFLFTTFIHAKLGISPPTRCLRCATDGSA